MPWIKGKFYMNPFYGRALERARSANEDADAHWVTIDGHHRADPSDHKSSEGTDSPD